MHAPLWRLRLRRCGRSSHCTNLNVLGNGILVFILSLVSDVRLVNLSGATNCLKFDTLLPALNLCSRAGHQVKMFHRFYHDERCILPPMKCSRENIFVSNFLCKTPDRNDCYVDIFKCFPHKNEIFGANLLRVANAESCQKTTA